MVSCPCVVGGASEVADVGQQAHGYAFVQERLDAFGFGRHDEHVFAVGKDFERDVYEAVVSLVEERFPKLNGRVLINNIGTTIGSHTGPGTVALFFWGSERVD